jgi:low affinity Fe/Cu permease
MEPDRNASFFTRFSKATSRLTGRSGTFFGAVALIAAWGLSGPAFGFSDTWQLVINTLTTVVTFLMVFLIQSTQNRDNEAIQIKLDELIRATQGAHNALLDLEELEEEELDKILARYQLLAQHARAALRRGGLDTGTKEGADEVADAAKERSSGRKRRR